MFDDIIKNPGKRMLKVSWTIELKQDLKYLTEVEREIKFTKDYEKWMEDYQKLIKKNVDFEITKTGVKESV